MGKGEIAHHEQFLLFPQCFQKACFLGASKGVTAWEWVKLKAFADDEINEAEKLSFVLGRIKTIVRKGDNVGYQHFLLFPQYFLEGFFL